MKYGIVIVCIVIFAAACLAGCVQGADDVVGVQAGRDATGGDAGLGSGVNLKDVGVELQGSKTVISLSFISGSRNAGVNEAKLSSVPSYSVSILPAPTRLKVGLDIDYTDYADKSETFKESIIYGMFKTNNGAGKAVYFQLSEDVEATVEETDATLKITLSPIGVNARDVYYVGLDALREYNQNLLPESLGLEPTLCDDQENIILISDAYATEQGAEQFAERVSQELSDILPNVQPYVFRMNTNELPEKVETDSGEAAVAAEPVVEIDGRPQELPVLLGNGRYLCETQAGEVVYARSYLPEAGQDTENVLMEEIWMLSGEEHTRLETMAFYSVEEAAISYNGRYLAILDSGIENKVLYVYDMQSGELRNLGEEGFGDVTTSFAWDEGSNVIYAMTGYNTLQLTKYDFSRLEYERVSSVEEKNGADSRIEVADGKIYFADSSIGEDGVVYSVDIQSAERSKVAEGMAFDVSPEGDFVAALQEVRQDEYAVTYDLLLYEAGEANGPETIAQNVAAFTFGNEEPVLYYSVAEAGDGEFGYSLARHNARFGNRTELGKIKTDMFVPAESTDELYVIEYVIQPTDSFYVTYILSVN